MSVGLHILQHSLILYISSIEYLLQISQPTSATMRPDQSPLKTGEWMATSVFSGLWTQAHGADIRSPFFTGHQCMCMWRAYLTKNAYVLYFQSVTFFGRLPCF